MKPNTNTNSLTVRHLLETSRGIRWRAVLDALRFDDIDEATLELVTMAADNAYSTDTGTWRLEVILDIFHRLAEHPAATRRTLTWLAGGGHCASRKAYARLAGVDTPTNPAPVRSSAYTIGPDKPMTRANAFTLLDEDGAPRRRPGAYATDPDTRYSGAHATDPDEKRF